MTSRKPAVKCLETFIDCNSSMLSSRELKQSQLKMVKREPASVVYIAGAGHMVR